MRPTEEPLRCMWLLCPQPRPPAAGTSECVPGAVLEQFVHLDLRMRVLHHVDQWLSNLFGLQSFVKWNHIWINSHPAYCVIKQN